MIERIVSGGQTGVDRGALMRRSISGSPAAAGAPRDGVPGMERSRRSIRSTRRRLRTMRGEREWNIRDSDGTLILHFGRLGVGPN